MSMKDFQKFLEEITIKGNPAIPGEGDKKEGEKPYLTDVQKRAMDRLGIRQSELSQPGRPSARERELGSRIMQLMFQSSDYITGKEKELSELATSVIYNLYKELIERYEIELDIQIIKKGRVKNFMDECENEDEPEPKFKEVTEEDIRNEVHKRKIANLIIQGEAKNTKHILHSEEVKEGLKRIYGEKRGEEAFKIFDELTDVADRLDWIIPANVRSQMMEMMPDGMAGASFVGWKPKEKKKEDESQEEEEYGEWTGEEDEEDMYSEEDEQPMERFDSRPVVRARGIDFPMLIHEAVKGMFECLSLGGIPEDTRTARIALSETGISDEPEDWKYGPEIAADLRDFINKNPKIDKFPNIREEVWKLMIDKETMPAGEFLSFVRGILSGTEAARKKMDSIIDRVVDKLEKRAAYKKYLEELEQYNRDMEEYEKQMRAWEESQKSAAGKEEKERESDIEKLVKTTISKEEDYSTWSQREILDEIDSALDSGDMDKVKELSKYVKEGKEVFLKELQLILEKKNLHTK